MFSLKYNFLAALNVGLSLLNFVIFIKIYGISEQSDAYLVANTIILTLHLIELLLIEQFLVFYNEKRAQSLRRGFDFYNSFLNFSMFSAIGFFVLFFISSPLIIDLFAQGFNQSQSELLTLFLTIVLFELLVFPVLTVNQKLLNAESFYALPYILSILPTVSVFGVGLYQLFSDKQQAEWLLVAKVAFILLATIISFLVIFRRIFKEQNYHLTIAWNEIRQCVKNSISMRFGHNIHNMLFLPIVTNALSYLPVGSNSYFFYCYRLTTMIANVATGPAGTILNAQMSGAWVTKNTSEAKRLIQKYLKFAPMVFVLVGGMVYLLIQLILPYLDASFTQNRIGILSSTFTLLLIWQLIVIIESPGVSVLIANKESFVFIFINSLFLLVFYLLVNHFWSNVTIAQIAISMIIAQLISLTLYSSQSRKVMLVYENKYINTNL